MPVGAATMNNMLYHVLTSLVSHSPSTVTCNRFGGDRFSYARMSWIKPNFLWMMYRSGWATKKGQEKILAVWITRAGFEEILSHALTGRQEKEREMDGRSQVRLQWDPDHDPHGVSQQRRAIQLGLRDEVMGVLNLATTGHYTHHINIAPHRMLYC